MRLRTLTGVAAALIASTALYAGQEGALKVTVLKPDKTPLVGATIRANVAVSSPTQINSAIVTKTDQNGVATFWKLSPGIFTIQVEVEAYEAGAIRTDVQADKVSHLQVLLRPQPAVQVGIEDTFDALDPTSATTSLNVKPEMIQTIPTGVTKRISDLALLVPGVMMSPLGAVPGGSTGSLGDPTLLVTVNRDKYGRNGLSTNNYLLDGIDVSQPFGGRGTVNIMQDLIADVDIKTGGVSAEYQAKNGIFYNATTINGSNDWHGAFTGDYTPNATRSKNKDGRPNINESSQSTGFYVDGPIIKSKLWIVAAAQKTLSHGDVELPDGVGTFTGERRPFTSNNEQNFFGKLTWQIDPANRLIGEYHSDRKSSNNGDDTTQTTNWLRKNTAGGDRYLLWYSFQQPWLIADFKAGHDYQRANVNDQGTGSTSTYIYSFDPLTPAQSQLGTYGVKDNEVGERFDYRADFLVPFSTGRMSHTLKFGYESAAYKYTVDIYTAPFYQNTDQPQTFDTLANYGLTYVGYFVPNILGAINSNPAYSSIRTALASTPGGDVTYGDLANYNFNQQDPNHPGTYSVFRIGSSVGSNPNQIKSTMNGFYVQDYMTLGNFTFSPGFRMDTYKITDDTGATIFNQSNLFAPRVSMSWDVFGDAKAKAYAYFGRYYNPAFGSTVRDTGTTKTTGTSADVYIMGQWVNIYDNPTSGPHLNLFGDDTKMPYTDEIRVGYDHIVKSGKWVNTFSVAGTYRKDQKIVQAANGAMFTDPDYLEAFARSYFGISNAPGSTTAQETRVINLFRGLALPVSTFKGGGLSGADNIANYTAVYINAPGAERTFKSVDLTWKAETTRGLFLLSYSWLDAQGTSMEVGDNTPTGSMPILDPRLPWMHGHQEGSIDWMVKAYGSYRFANDFIVGFFGRMDSGFHYTSSMGGGGGTVVPAVPMDVNQVDSFKIGDKMTPKRVSFDLHLEKRFQVSEATQLWLSANVYNLFNNQNGTALAEGTNIRAGVAADQPYLYNPPRAISFSAKLRF